MSAMLLQCLSHTPLMGRLDPGHGIEQEVESALGRLRATLHEFEPDVIFLFGPDHFNGFFYDLMPPFCIGASAWSIGDYECPKGALDVPAELAVSCMESVLEQGVDCAVSHRMRVDHGFAQPLQLLAGALDRYPVVPVFINSVAAPLPSMHRARMLGEAIGRFAATLDRRVVFMGSGGLSHNPPVPSLATAPPELAERLIDGRNVTVEQRNAREARTLEAAKEYAAGGSNLTPINPDWDRDFLEALAQRDFAVLDAMSNVDITTQAGGSGHEVKTWMAANAAMAAATAGRYRAQQEYYRAIPEWIAGFATLQGTACR